MARAPRGQTAEAVRPGVEFRLADLGSRVGAEVVGDGGVTIDRVGTLENAQAGAITFLTSARYRSLLATTRAAAVIVSPADADATPLPRLVHANPYATYARVAAMLYPAAEGKPGIDATARVADGARVDPAASIGAYAVVETGAQIGPRAVVGAHCVVGADVCLGDGVQLYPRVTLYPRTVVGARTIIHSGAVIGADGFGMAHDGARWVKIPQVGRVLIGEDCEIGANTTIDRGAIDDTVIEDDVKLDNQVQVGHNCRIGAHTAIAGCTGIAGSADVGRNVRIGGAANIAGHLHIADGTVIAGASTVIGNLRTPGVYTSIFPLIPQDEWRHVAVGIRRIRMLSERVSEIERALLEQKRGRESAE